MLLEKRTILLVLITHLSCTRDCSRGLGSYCSPVLLLSGVPPLQAQLTTTSYKKIRVGDSYRLSWTSNGQRWVYSARCAGQGLITIVVTFISTPRNEVSVAAYPFGWPSSSRGVMTTCAGSVARGWSFSERLGDHRPETVRMHIGDRRIPFREDFDINFLFFLCGIFLFSTSF